MGYKYLICVCLFSPLSDIAMSSERLYDMPERRLLILFATETGTAQDIADRIARESRNLLFKSQVVSVDCYTLVCFFS